MARQSSQAMRTLLILINFVRLINFKEKDFIMLVQKENEVEVLSASEVSSCSKIAKAVHGAWSSGLKRDEFINLASDELVKITSKTPSYELHKSVQAQVIQDLINLGLAVDSAEVYYSKILKQAIAKHLKYIGLVLSRSVAVLCAVTASWNLPNLK